MSLVRVVAIILCRAYGNGPRGYGLYLYKEDTISILFFLKFSQHYLVSNEVFQF